MIPLQEKKLVEKLEYDRSADGGDATPRDDNTQRLLSLFVALVPAAGIVYLIAVILSDEPMLRSVGVIATVCAALGAFALLKTKHSAAAAHVLVWGCWLSLELQIFVSNGLASRSLMALPIVITMAAWLLTPRSAIALSVASVLCGLVLALGEQAGLLPVFAEPSPPLLVWLATSTYIGLSSALAYYIFRGFGLRHEALQRSEEKFATAFRAGPLAMSITRLSDGRFLDVNEAFVGLLGWSRGDILGRTAPDIGLWLAPADRESWAQELRQTGRLANREMHWRTRSGALREVQMSSVVIELDGEPCALVLASDITERKRAGEKFAKVFHASPEPISISRLRDGLYLDVNVAFVQQLGWRRDEVVGRSALDLGVWPNPADRQRWVAQLRRYGRVRSHEAVLRAKNGNRHTALISAELFDLDGEQCVIGMIYDITEQEAARQEIRRLNAELEQRVEERTAELTAVNRELESFAYSISHDLRAPLRGIDGFSQMALEEYGDRLDAQGRGYIERVRAAAQRMGGLIDDILELSRISRKQMVCQAVDLGRMAGEILDEFRQSGPERTVEARIAGNLTVQGDPQLLRVVIQNLLENAWKYTGKETAAVIEFDGREENGERVFRMRDNGVGFDMAYASRLFAPFQRLHRPEEFEGTGIGLATVARIVHRHGGRIWAESAPGHGAVFHFTLAGRNGGHSAQ